MTMLWAAAAVFLGTHLLISGTRLRDGLTAAIGEVPYTIIYSLIAVGALVWLVHAYNAVRGGADDTQLFDLGIGVRHLAIPVVALAFFLGVQGLLSPNPTAVAQQGAAARTGTVQGVVRITRHPFLWGVALWAGFHVAANGDLASVVLFGSLLALALLGTFSIDAKRKRKMGADWQDFAGRTSNIPFAAILSGRVALHIGESLGWRFVAAAAVFLAILFSHAHLFGASPFPNNWVPF